MEGCSTIAWWPVNAWTVNVSGADCLKAHGSSDVCSAVTQATLAQKSTQVAKFTMASAWAVGSKNGGLIHHRMMSGQLLDSQSFRRRSPKGAQKLRYVLRADVGCAQAQEGTHVV